MLTGIITFTPFDVYSSHCLCQRYFWEAWAEEISLSSLSDDKIVDREVGEIFRGSTKQKVQEDGKINISSKKQRWGKVSKKILVFALTVLSLSAGCVPGEEPTPARLPPETEVELPEPRQDSAVSIEETLLKRRSVRHYTGEPLTLQEVSQLLWAAQGTTDPRGFRTAPSAGATYPLETYIVVGDVQDLTEGVYRYESAEHKLVKVLDGDLRAQLAGAALG